MGDKEGRLRNFRRAPPDAQAERQRNFRRGWKLDEPDAPQEERRSLSASLSMGRLEESLPDLQRAMAEALKL